MERWWPLEEVDAQVLPARVHRHFADEQGEENRWKPENPQKIENQKKTGKIDSSH